MDAVGRRRFLIAAGASFVWPATLSAQAPRRYRIGWLSASNEGTAQAGREGFLAGMRELGYVQGRNLMLDVRYADGDLHRLPALAAELVALKPDVLLGNEVTGIALRGKTKTIPIVLGGSLNPVAAGLAQSLARPGTNVTGLASQTDELVLKHMELLREIRPKMQRAALLTRRALANDPHAAALERLAQTAKSTAAAMGLTLTVASVREPADVVPAFAQIETERAEGIVEAVGPLGVQVHHEIITEARRARLPLIGAQTASWVEAGGFATYGPNFAESFRYAATFVDRILKGAKPAEMPIEQPRKFELILNLKTAREIAVMIPQAILLRADRVIE